MSKKTFPKPVHNVSFVEERGDAHRFGWEIDRRRIAYLDVYRFAGGRVELSWVDSQQLGCNLGEFSEIEALTELAGGYFDESWRASVAIELEIYLTASAVQLLLDGHKYYVA